ncbi:MAG: metallophosphoesterase family protein, partial [Parcubacteria group bacterium]|nr:metallophosphoesterase family protein [Parcubacteria group bacterium]
EGTVDLVKGNMDEGYWNEEDIAKDTNIHFFGKNGAIELEGMKIGFTHKPVDAQSLAKSGKYDIVFYGHTHQPWQEKIKECLLINPGNCAGNPAPATFAICDAPLMKLELKIIENL